MRPHQRCLRIGLERVLQLLLMIVHPGHRAAQERDHSRLELPLHWYQRGRVNCGAFGCTPHFTTSSAFDYPAFDHPADCGSSHQLWAFATTSAESAQSLVMKGLARRLDLQRAPRPEVLFRDRCECLDKPGVLKLQETLNRAAKARSLFSMRSPSSEAPHRSASLRGGNARLR